jgi:hypothetical protein
VMIRLVTILLLLFEMPILSNAAEIRDSYFISFDEEKTKRINVNNETVFEYNTALQLILKKNVILKKTHLDSTNYEQDYLTYNFDKNAFIQSSNSNNAPIILVETESAWTRIKGRINSQLSIFDSKIQFILYENVDFNSTFVFDVDGTKLSNKKSGLYKSEDITYERTFDEKNYNSLSSSSPKSSGLYFNEYDKKNVFSLIISLIEKNFDTVIWVLVIAIIWLVVLNLISMLTMRRPPSR